MGISIVQYNNPKTSTPTSMLWIYVVNYICPKITLPLSLKPQGREIAMAAEMGVYRSTSVIALQALKCLIFKQPRDALSHDSCFLHPSIYLLFSTYICDSRPLLGVNKYYRI